MKLLKHIVINKEDKNTCFQQIWNGQFKNA